ncbi:hypothetical protein CVIRNUC_008492 [Coccomyxa viridis]|uniref:AAA+ ATPase domain-containing protein n=1 Tax=Coccomyxa viridis TaxID=1274662 RepID=A0AAV1IF02_9CHLO|nr:hypothetical protein CVIRNUC_008492 [Coccomyxa viridis]
MQTPVCEGCQLQLNGRLCLVPRAVLASPLQSRPKGRLKSLLTERKSSSFGSKRTIESGRRDHVHSQESGGCSASLQALHERGQRELEKLVTVLPERLAATVLEQPDFPELVEIVMDLGRPPLARFPSGDLRLADDVISSADLEHAISKLGDFGDDNRAGIDRTLHRISCMRNRDGRIVGLTCRAGRAVLGSAAMAADLVASGSSILFMGRPGVGKTTVIREMARLLSVGHNRRVVIVDTSNEIGGDGDIAHSGIGRARRMQVAYVAEQHRTMIEAVENHMPETVIVDEIGTEAEALAARSIAQRGVQLVATAHGGELARLIKNPTLSDLIGGIQTVTLSDDEAKRRRGQKTVIERMAPPTFDVAVEIIDRHCWRVHPDVAQAVDALLRGSEAEGEVRVQNADGSVEVQPEEELWDATSSSDEDDRSLAPLATAAAPSWASSEWQASEAGAVQILPHGLDGHQVKEVVGSMQLQRIVLLTDRLQDADAVLTTRDRLKGGDDALIMAARAAGQPIFSMKTSSQASMVKALRSLAGIDPSPLSLRDASAVVDADPSNGRHAPLRSEDEIARLIGRSNIVSKTNAKKRSAALEEVRAAVEELVLAGGHAAELLPRSPDVMQAQEELVRSYNLPFEIVGTKAETRIRILPKGFLSEEARESQIGKEWTRSEGWAHI